MPDPSVASLRQLIPPGPGTYALQLVLPEPINLLVGRLERVRLTPGCYVYAGSALGPGGLRGRLLRHVRSDKRIHWHIDYLAAVAQLHEIWLMEGSHRQECQWASWFGKLPVASAPIARFGAADCGCAAHLARLNEPPDFDVFLRTFPAARRLVIDGR